MKSNFKLILCILFLVRVFNISTAQNNADDIIHTAHITDNLISPVRMAIDIDNNLYITDNKQNCIIKYDSAGIFIEKLLLPFTPVSVVADKSGCLFIGAKKSGNIFKRDTEGNISLFYEGCGFPSSLEFNPAGFLYIVDSELHNVTVLDMSAKLIQKFGSEILIYPTSIAYDSRNERILIGEHGGLGTGFKPVCKIRVFDLSGNLINSFGSYGNKNGEFYRITDVNIGKCGNIYVCDSYQGTISIFDENFEFITKFGTYGSNPGELNVPIDIEFDSNENIFISSINNGAVEVFNVTDTLPTSNILYSDYVLCSGKQKDIKFYFTGTPPWNFTYTLNGVNPVTLTTDKSPYVLSVSEPGIYQVTQLSDANFSGTCFSGAAIISEYNPPASVDISTQTPSVCEEDTAIIRFDLNGTPPWNLFYSINSNNTQSITTEKTPYFLYTQEEGKYQITYFSDKYCESDNLGSVDISVTEETVPDFDSDIKGLSVKFINTSDFADSYFWDFGDGTSSTETNPSHIFENEGSYSVTLTASNLVCGDNTIKKRITLTSLSTNELNNPGFFQVYPNPSDGKFIVEIHNTDKFNITLEVISMTGKIVCADLLHGTDIVKHVDLRNLSTGIYTVKITSEKFTKTLKLVLSN